MRPYNTEVAHGEHLIQEVSRICGIYREGVPLTIWCTTNMKAYILEHLRFINTIQELLLENSPCIPIQIIECEGFKEQLAKFNRPLKLTRPAVQRGWVMKTVRKRLVHYDAGNLHKVEYGCGVVPMSMLPAGLHADVLNEHSHMDVLRTLAGEVFGRDCPDVHLLDEVHKLSWRIKGKTNLPNCKQVKSRLRTLKVRLNIRAINKMSTKVHHSKFAAASFRVFHGKHYTHKHQKYGSYGTWKFARHSGLRMIVRRRLPTSVWNVGSVHAWRTWNYVDNDIHLMVGRMTAPVGITMASTRRRF